MIQRILFVCHGNICRSVMAHCLMVKLLADAGVRDCFVDSAATSTEELGNAIHPGAAGVLRQHGVPLVAHRARQIRTADLQNFELILAADTSNLAGIRRILGEEGVAKTRLLMSLAGEDRGIADPWYTGDFEETWQDVLRGCNALLQIMQENT